MRSLKNLKLIHLLLPLSWLIFAVLSLYLVETHKLKPRISEDYLLVPGFIGMAIVFAMAIGQGFKSKLNSIRRGHETLEHKFVKLSSSAIRIWIITQGICLVALLGYMLTGRLIFVVTSAVLMLFVFNATSPTVSRMANGMGTTEEIIRKEF